MARIAAPCSKVMKEMRVVQMFVGLAARKTGLPGLTFAASLSASPAHASVFGDLVDKVQDGAGQLVDRGFEYAVWLMDQATDVAGRFNEWAMVELERVGMDTHQAALIGGSILIALFGFWLLPRGPRSADEGVAEGEGVALAAGKRGKRAPWRLRDAVDAMKADVAREAQNSAANVE
jgi:hypothetical protein